MNEDKTKNYFQITTDRMYTAIEAFHLWKRINEMMNVNNVGKEKAERNVEIFRKYWDFFHPVVIASYKSFVIDLSIFFDADKFENTFSLSKLMSAIREKTSDVEFEELTTSISEIKRKHGIRINFILELRNTEVSHQEIDRKKRFVVYQEIEGLFVGVQEILNVLRKYYDGAFTVWDHVPREIIKDLEWVVDNLERGEKVRLEEIEKRYRT